MMGAGQPISCVATVGFDDDGVKTTEFPIVRDGILVGLQTDRETAPLIRVIK